MAPLQATSRSDKEESWRIDDLMKPFGRPEVRMKRWSEVTTMGANPVLPVDV
jgi:hypothetical protein